MISTTPQISNSLSEKVLALGYHLYIEKGCPEGAESEIWKEAERMLNLRTASSCESPQGDHAAR